MPRGGAREGAGRKSTWPSGCKFPETTLIRVPADLKEHLLVFAKELDRRRSLDLVTEYYWSDSLVSELETKSKEKVRLEQSDVTTDDLADDSQLSLMVEDQSQPYESGLATNSNDFCLKVIPMSKHLQVSETTLRRNTIKNDRSKLRVSREDCIAWTKEHDPSGIGWEYDFDEKVYYQVTD